MLTKRLWLTKWLWLTKLLSLLLASVEVVTAKTESVEVEENIVLSEDVLSEEEATPASCNCSEGH